MPDLYAIARGTSRLCRLTHYETRRVRGTEGEYVVAWLDDGSPSPWLLTALRVGTLEDWARWSRREADGSLPSNPFDRWLYLSLLDAIRSARWRSEVSLCRQFAGRPSDGDVEDALYALVTSGKVEWFGRNDRPLRYRVAASRTPEHGRTE